MSVTWGSAEAQEAFRSTIINKEISNEKSDELIAIIATLGDSDEEWDSFWFNQQALRLFPYLAARIVDDEDGLLYPDEFRAIIIRQGTRALLGYPWQPGKHNRRVLPITGIYFWGKAANDKRVPNSHAGGEHIVNADLGAIILLMLSIKDQTLSETLFGELREELAKDRLRGDHTPNSRKFQYKQFLSSLIQAKEIDGYAGITRSWIKVRFANRPLLLHTWDSKIARILSEFILDGKGYVLQVTFDALLDDLPRTSFYSGSVICEKILETLIRTPMENRSVQRMIILGKVRKYLKHHKDRLAGKPGVIEEQEMLARLQNQLSTF